MTTDGSFTLATLEIFTVVNSNLITVVSYQNDSFSSKLVDGKAWERDTVDLNCPRAAVLKCGTY